MERTITIADAKTCVEAMNAIAGIPQDSSHKVVISAKKETRTSLQNRCYHGWATVMAKKRGLTLEEMKTEYKERFFKPIFIRDDPGYASLWETVRDLWRQGMKDESQIVAKGIINLTSSTQANTAQMAEVLNNIDFDAANLGVHLPRPSDPEILFIEKPDRK